MATESQILKQKSEDRRQKTGDRIGKSGNQDKRKSGKNNDNFD